ncbi:hypothetical protein BH10BAC4_BH10BAC4_14000 [soil metagenome]
MRIRFIILSAILIFLNWHDASATHLRAGEITITRQSCTSLTFNITITVFTNTGSAIKFGDGLLDFGDGSKPLRTPTIDNINRSDLGPNIGTVTYSTTHTYGGAGRYVVSYGEPNRNAGILNMFNSVDTPFYMEASVSIDPFVGCDNSPRLLVPPIDKACTGAAFYHNPGAYDPDGDSLSYEFTVPKRDKGIPVNNYRDPNVKEFYDRVGLNYGTANEGKNGSPTFTINPITGTIIWDAPGAPGEYNIAFVVKEWRKIAGTWINLGYVVRDMQIIVDDCNNKRPELQVPADLCVEAGTKITADIFGTDPEHDNVKIEAFSQILNANLNPPFPNPATYTPFPAKYQKSFPSPAKLSFVWQTTCLHVKEQPYQVVFKITDTVAVNRGAKLVQFKTWNIRVVGPAPKWKPAAVVPYRTGKLEWEPYVCDNAVVMQVWRRVDSYPFIPPVCVTGMPDFLGFTKIAELPITQSKYSDTNGGKGLNPGAKYCYRLVAVFPSPGGGSSYVSAEMCLDPIPATAPVITHVTVDKTSSTTSPTSGKITVKWRAPLDRTVFPDTTILRYRVKRAEGLAGTAFVTTHAGVLTNTFYQDSDINTEEIAYTYKVEALVGSTQLNDTTTSAAASSVRLEVKSQFKQLQLNWSANVPWSNQSPKFPYHIIYRGPAGATESQLVKIDSIKATAGKFTYVDTGLDNTQTYCYRVLTKGVYGNPKIKEPFLNYSQINCAQPNDDTPPCKPELKITATSCDQYPQNTPCAPTTFSNTLTWARPLDAACRQDVKSYNIYIAAQVGDEYSLHASNVVDTFYVDTQLPSYARCYKIKAVDRAGLESEFSDSFCFDNCPHYELPNVFTPNGDNCNEKFSAFSDRDVIDENGNGPCGTIDPIVQRTQCARFVESVYFTVNNRWGKAVYEYQSGGEKNIYIDWDGKDNNGKELSAGVYYYNAQVTFTVVDPKQRVKDIRGWVQIIR